MSRQSYAEVWTYEDPATENLKAAKNLEVTVYKAGTSEKATIYEAREGGSAMSNPFISDENGLVLFWAGTGEYDIKFHDTVLPARFGDFVIGWLSAPLNVEIDAAELSNKGDVEWTQEVSGAWVPKLKSGVVGLTDLENAAFIPSSRFDAATQQTLFQAGDIKASARPTAPSGWLLCNGASQLRSSFASLFSAIGTTYGSVDSTHFNVPNILGRTMVGAGLGSGLSNRVIGASGGEESHQLSEGEMPTHRHGRGDLHTQISVNEQFQVFTNASGSTFGASGFKAIPNWGNISNLVEGNSSYVGGGGSHNNMQPFVVVNFFIKT